MKKVLKIFLLGMIAIALFSCDNTTETPEMGYKDFYVLWDNIGIVDRTIFWETGYGMFPELDENILLKEKLEELEIHATYSLLRNFTITEERDIYMVYLDQRPLSEDGVSIPRILRYTYSPSSNGTHSGPEEIFSYPSVSDFETSGISDIAASDGKIYVTHAFYTPGTIEKEHFYVDVIDIASKKMKPIVIDEQGLNIVSAIHVLSDGSLLCAGKKTAESNSSECFIIKKTGDSFVPQPSQTLDFIPDIEGLSNAEVVMDFQEVDGAIYALISFDRNAVTHGENEMQGGAISRINVDNGVISIDESFGNNGIFGFERKDCEYGEIEVDGSFEYVCYPELTEQSEFFYHPVKFIALTPKKLVIADEGFYWDEKSTGSDKRTEGNSVVFVDLENGQPSFSKRVILKDVHFHQNHELGTTDYMDCSLLF